jgi:hypothetical protein
VAPARADQTKFSQKYVERPTKPSEMLHEIVRIPSVGRYGREQLLQQCYDVRINVFHREQGFPLDSEIDKLCSSELSTLSCGQGFAYFRSFSD